MDFLIISGVLIIKIGIGFIQQKSNTKSKSGPVMCHYECNGNKQPPIWSGLIIVSLDLFLLGLRGGSPHYPLSISYCSYIYRHLCVIIIPEMNNYEKKYIWAKPCCCRPPPWTQAHECSMLSRVGWWRSCLCCEFKSRFRDPFSLP